MNQGACTVEGLKVSRRAGTILCLAQLLYPVMAQEAPEAQLSTVRGLVRSLAGPNAARSNNSALTLYQLGDSAVPALREMALESEDGDAILGARPLADAITLIATGSSTKLLTRIVQADTEVHPALALIQLFKEPASSMARVTLRRDPVFMNAAYASVGSKDTDSVLSVIQAVRRLGYKEAGPILEQLFREGPPDIRDAANDAWSVLFPGGRERRSGVLQFPESNTDLECVLRIGDLPSGAWVSSGAAFLKWFDGRRCLVILDDQTLRVYDLGFSQTDEVTLPWFAHDCAMISTADGSSLLILLVSDSREPLAEYFVAVDSSFDLQWTYRPRSGALHDLSVLFAADGQELGVVAASATRGIVTALGSDGKVLATFEVPGQSSSRMNDMLGAVGTVKESPSVVVQSFPYISIFDLYGNPIAGEALREEFLELTEYRIIE